MRVYHATDRVNEPGIKRLGLLAKLSSGRRPAVWAVSRKHVDYAIAHCCLRRKVPANKVVLLEINVPRKWLKRFPVDGVYYIPRDIPPERIRVYGRMQLVREE